MKNLHVGTSPITNRIFAGHVLKDGQTWGEGKCDVTGAACAAVAQFVLAHGKPVIVTEDGIPKYAIQVQNLEPENERAPTIHELTDEEVTDGP